MQFSEGSFYHIYNRGNNKRRIFFDERNYDFFLQKVRKYIGSRASILAWCLMPNHFHFLIYATNDTVAHVKETPVKVNALTEGIRLLLSSYTKAIQKQEGITGNLFQQKTKCVCADDYLTTAFHYIHQNPFRANLVHRIEDWSWSSFPEYLGLAPAGICARDLMEEYIGTDEDRLLTDAYAAIPDEFISSLL
jgi:REP element-mobilizing transposase RayT